MIQLLSIEVVNFRLIRDARIDFPDEGITAINGEVGAGKSTFLWAMLWAMCAITPDGVPVKEVRRQGSDGQPCRVVTRFRHDGQVIEVTRALEGRLDSTTALLKVDGVEAVKGPVAVAKWVENRIGLDAEGFTTACVIMQKQVDALVKAKPEARRSLMERMFGIERLTVGMKNARDEATAAKRFLDGLPGTGEELAEAEAALLLAQTTAASLWEEYESTRENADAALVTANTTNADWVVVQSRAVRHAELVTETNRFAHVRDLAQAKADTLTEEADRFNAGSIGGDPAALGEAQDTAMRAGRAFARHEQLAIETSRAAETSTRDGARADTLTARASQATETADTAARDADSKASRAGELAGLIGRVTAADERRAATAAAQDRGAALADHQRLTASLALLDQSSDPACPTCRAVVSDPVALREEIVAELAVVVARGRAAKTEEERAVAAADVTEQVTRDAERATDASKTARGRVEQFRVDAERAAVDARDAQMQADASKIDADRLAGQSGDHDQDAARLAAEKTTADTALRDTQRAADALAALPAARNAAEQAHLVAHDATTTVEKAQATADVAAVPDSEITTVRVTAETAERTATELALATERASGTAAVAAEKADRAEADRNFAQGKLTARSEALARWEQKSAVADALAAFRKDRVAQIGPEVAEIASDLLARMSGGAYTQVELDENFTPYVTSRSGNVRAAAMLSGGEESQVALALRIAAGDVVSGQRGGLLMVDEVLTSQSKDKRGLIVDVFRSLPGRQVVMINHASEATDMVDHVFHLIRNDPDGSYLATHTAGTVTDDDLEGETLGVLTDAMLAPSEDLTP